MKWRRVSPRTPPDKEIDKIITKIEETIPFLKKDQEIMFDVITRLANKSGGTTLADFSTGIYIRPSLHRLTKPYQPNRKELKTVIPQGNDLGTNLLILNSQPCWSI